jgi:hypothetical protein
MWTMAWKTVIFVYCRCKDELNNISRSV